ncbi:MAG: aminotransferase class V-fold PLP-dependent enzyme [Candidatus Latescibacteria bacterium]|nr:aminotransferase class V-fold PLP-dependent enzyme [Candidatus Latescibacterota bacterium]
MSLTIDESHALSSFQTIREVFFPVANTMTYLNNATTTPHPTNVLRAMEAYTRERISMTADFGRWMHQADGVRDGFARLIGGTPEEVAFVASASHGLSIVASGLTWKTGENVVLPCFEFPGNVYPWMNLKRFGVEVRLAGTPEGRVSVEDIERLIDDRTRLVAVSYVENRNGFRNNLREIGGLCHRRGLFFAVDATHGAGVLPIDVDACHIDALVSSTYKWLFAPVGVGCFYCRQSRWREVYPVQVGWTTTADPFNQFEYNFLLPQHARRYEVGNLNYPVLHALDAALELILEVGIDRISRRVLELTGRLMEELPGAGARVTSATEEERRSGIVTIVVPNQDRLMAHLQARKIHVLAFPGGRGIRISPHFYNNEADIDRLIEAVRTAR